MPARRAFGAPTGVHEELADSATIIGDDAVRVVVISGAGDKAFSAGADISQFAEKRSDKAATDDYNATVRKALEAVDRLGKPTIAMVQGFCVGGGMSLATHFDMRIASDDSRFGIPAAKLGLAYRWEDVHALVQLIGPTFTREILYTGRLFDATEAQQMGLVNRVMPQSELQAFVSDYAARIAANAGARRAHCANLERIRLHRPRNSDTREQ